MNEIRLIEAVKKFKLIYDKDDANYHNKREKDKAWELISTYVGRDKKYCRDRWKSLRDKFVREISKQWSGSDSEEIPIWRFLEPMMFLEEHVAVKRQSLTPAAAASVRMEESNDAADASEVIIEQLDDDEMNVATTRQMSPADEKPSTISPPLKKRKIYTNSVQFSELNQTLQNLSELIERKITGGATVANSRNDSFYKVLDSYLMKLDEDKQDLVKVKLLQYVMLQRRSFNANEEVF